MVSGEFLQMDGRVGPTMGMAMDMGLELGLRLGKGPLMKGDDALPVLPTSREDQKDRRGESDGPAAELVVLPGRRAAPGPPRRVGGYDAEHKWHGVDVKEQDNSVYLSGLALRCVQLAPLDACVALKEISLAANRLTEIDLAPLAGLPNLEAVVLNGNSLERIDLRPLALCRKLEKLWLHNNALLEIDLEPLRSCVALRSLYLDGNQMHAKSLDLSPLAKCKVLRSLRLGRNRLGGVLDITPVLTCAALSSLDVSASVKLVARVQTDKLSAHAAAQALPPALRRKAATVIWKRESLYHPQHLITSPVSSSSSSSSCSSSPSCSSSSSSSSSSDEEDGFTELGYRLSSNHRACSRETVPGRRSLYPDEPPSSRKGTRTEQERQQQKENSAFALEPSNSYFLDQQKHRHRHHEYVAILIGFRRNARFALEVLLAEQGNLKTVVVSPATNTRSFFASGALSSAHVILVQPTAEKLMAGIRAAEPTIPIIVVGEQGASEAAARCLRCGASCFLTSPLGARDAITIRALAQQSARARSSRQRRGAAAGAAQNDPRRRADSHRSSPPRSAGRGCANKVFSPLSPASAAASQTPSIPPSPPCAAPPWSPRPAAAAAAAAHPAPAADAPSPATVLRRLRARCAGLAPARGAVEDSALAMLFSRLGGAAAPPDFKSVATLCGLPMCAARLLYKAVSRYCGAEVRAEGGAPVSVGAFRAFWKAYMRARTPETRLFNVLVLAYMDERVLRRINRNGMCCAAREEGAREGEGDGDEEEEKEDVQSLVRYTVRRKAIAELGQGLVGGRSQVLAGEVLCYSLCGGRWRALSSRMISKAMLCGSLLAAESGVFHGVCGRLRADRLTEIRQSFYAACGARGLNAVQRSDAMYFCAQRGLFTPRAVEAIFDRDAQKGSRGLGLGEWAALWLSAKEAGSVQAAEYMWEIMDLDLDGYVDAGDCAVFYMEKRRLMARKNLVPARFEYVWNGLVDNVGGGSGLDARKGGGSGGAGTGGMGRKNRLSRQQFCRVSEKERLRTLRSLLFIDDDMTLLDLSRTNDEDYLNALNEDELAASVAPA